MEAPQGTISLGKKKKKKEFNVMVLRRERLPCSTVKQCGNGLEVTSLDQKWQESLYQPMAGLTSPPVVPPGGHLAPGRSICNLPMQGWEKSPSSDSSGESPPRPPAIAYMQVWHSSTTQTSNTLFLLISLHLSIEKGSPGTETTCCGRWDFFFIM